MDDQRCELPRPDIKKSSNGQGAQAIRNSTSRAANSQKGAKSNSLVPPTEMKPSVSTENLFDILQRVQGNRIDEQRSSIQPLPGLDPACKFLCVFVIPRDALYHKRNFILLCLLVLFLRVFFFCLLVGHSVNHLFIQSIDRSLIFSIS